MRTELRSVNDRPAGIGQLAAIAQMIRVQPVKVAVVTLHAHQSRVSTSDCSLTSRREDSNRGVQYTDTEFRALLTAKGFEQSMIRAGETCDNAYDESLFSHYKAEMLHDGVFGDVAEAELEIFDYIEQYYNRIRRHSALGYVSQINFEIAYYQRTKSDSKLDERNLS